MKRRSGPVLNEYNGSNDEMQKIMAMVRQARSYNEDRARETYRERQEEFQNKQYEDRLKKEEREQENALRKRIKAESLDIRDKKLLPLSKDLKEHWGSTKKYWRQ